MSFGHWIFSSFLKIHPSYKFLICHKKYTKTGDGVHCKVCTVVQLTVCFQMLVTFSRWFFDQISTYALDFWCGDTFPRTNTQVRKLCVGGHLYLKLSKKRDQYLKMECLKYKRYTCLIYFREAGHSWRSEVSFSSAIFRFIRAPNLEHLININ